MHACTHARKMHACSMHAVSFMYQQHIKAVLGEGGTLKACPASVFHEGAHADCGAWLVQVGIPEMISFAAIIFKDDIYTQYLDQLAKLAFLGSAMHQFVFTIFSSLPYAVAQVRAASKAAVMLITPRLALSARHAATFYTISFGI